MDSNSCLLEGVRWTLEKGCKEVAQGLLLSNRGPVFKIESYINERATVGARVLLLDLKRPEDKFFVACDMLAGSDCRGK
jgi:hypothetical protein